MEGVGEGGGGYIGSVGINSFFLLLFSFFFSEGAKYWDLATVTCNLYLFILHYIIHGSWLHLTLLHLAEILGGIFGSSITFFLSSFSPHYSVSIPVQYSTIAVLDEFHSSLPITPVSLPTTQ